MGHVESARGRVERYSHPELTKLFEWADRGEFVVQELQEMLSVGAAREDPQKLEEKEDKPPAKRQRGFVKTEGGGREEGEGGGEASAAPVVPRRNREREGGGRRGLSRKGGVFVKTEPHAPVVLQSKEEDDSDDLWVWEDVVGQGVGGMGGGRWVGKEGVGKVLEVPAPLVHFDVEEEEDEGVPLMRHARWGAKGGK